MIKNTSSADGTVIDSAAEYSVSLILLENGESAKVTTTPSTTTSGPIMSDLKQKIDFLQTENQNQAEEILEIELELDEVEKFISEQKKRNLYQIITNMNLAEKLYSPKTETVNMINLMRQEQLRERKNMEKKIISVLDVMGQQIAQLQAQQIRPK